MRLLLFLVRTTGASLAGVRVPNAQSKTQILRASYETWCGAIKRYKWNRPRRRIYPAKPKVGIRAKGPGQLLHLDVTIIRLLDGKRAFLHAVQDNFSRRLMAWALRPTLAAETTRELVNRALQVIAAMPDPTRVMTDGGCVNLCLTEINRVVHVVAQVDIAQSNSLFESLWSRIKSPGLYIHTLDSFQVSSA